MRNFILSPNFKHSVKASFLSLVILIASLNFGCCLNASAMFGNSPHAYPSGGNIPPTSVVSSSDKTTRDEGYPSSFVPPNADGDNNTKPTGGVDLSKDIDKETFIKQLNFLAEIPYLASDCIADEMAISIFPNNTKKQEALRDNFDYFNMCVFKKQRYYEETGKGTPENYEYQIADALKVLHGEEPDNDDSCDKYFKAKLKKLSPEEINALREIASDSDNWQVPPCWVIIVVSKEGCSFCLLNG